MSLLSSLSEENAAEMQAYKEHLLEQLQQKELERLEIEGEMTKKFSLEKKCPDFVPKKKEEDEELPIAGESLCKCLKRQATVLCTGCKKPICNSCVADYHYVAGPLCYECFKLEQQRQRELSSRSF